MKFRKNILAVSIALFISVMGLIPMALASTSTDDVIGNCTLTGYSYMGGKAKISTSDALNPYQRDYFIAEPLTFMYGTTDMWGYAWLKFEVLSDTTVESAYLALDLLAVGGMVMEDASAEYPGVVDIYSPGDVDVTDLWASSANTEAAEAAEALRVSLHDTLLESDPLLNVVMSSNGTYYIDITELYNGWVTGEIENNGIILVGTGQNSSDEIGNIGAMFAGFNSDEGNAPYITTTAPVPVPAGLWLLGSGLIGLIGLRRRSR